MYVRLAVRNHSCIQFTSFYPLLAEEDGFFDALPDVGSQPHQIYTQACLGLDTRPVKCIYEALKKEEDRVTCKSLVLKHKDVQACTIALVVRKCFILYFLYSSFKYM